MKRLLSLVLVFLMVIGTGLCNVSLVAATDDGLIFSMDLSDSTDSTVVVKDTATDSVTENIENGTGNTIGTIEKTGKKYLVIGDTAATAGVRIEDSDVMTAATQNITLEWWAQADSDPASGWMMSLTNNKNAGGKYALKGQGTFNGSHDWRFDIDHSGGSVMDFGITPNGAPDWSRWNHFAITRSYDSGTSTNKAIVYVNGVKMGEKSFKGTVITPSYLYIGKARDTAAMYAGNIGDFKIYNKAFTENEVKAKYTDSFPDYYGEIDTSGLVFDLDLSGYNASSSDSAKGIVDKTADVETETLKTTAKTTVKTLNFGEDDVSVLEGGLDVNDAGVDAAASGKTMTIEYWMKAKGGSHYLLYTKGSSGNHNWQIMSDAATTSEKTGNIGFIDRLHANTSYQTNHLTEGTYEKWAHYVFLREYTEAGCVQTLYVNGVKVNEATISAVTAPQNVSGYTMHIGGGSYASNAVQMNGSIATFRVYNKILSADEIKATYDAEKLKFVNTAINLESVSPEGGTEDEPVSLAPTSGSFTMTFDNDVDDKSLGAISFAKIGGNKVDCNISVSSTSGKVVNVSYGALDELSDYVLTIGADLSSAYGKKLGTSTSYYYKTTKKPSPIFLDIDFEDETYVVGEKPSGDDGLTYISSGVEGNTDNFLVREKNGDKYLTYTVSQKEKAASSQLLYKMTEATNGRSLVFELGIRGYVEGSEAKFGTCARDVMRVYNKSGTELKLLQASRVTSSNSITTMGNVAVTKPDANGFHNLKIVITKDETNSYYIYDVYDNASSSLQYTRIIPTEQLTDITKVMFAHVYPTDPSQYENEGVAISYVKGYFIEQPRLADTNIEELTWDAQNIKIYFDKEMKKESLEKGTYILEDSHGNDDIKLSYSSYNSTDKCVTLAFSDYLISGERYTVKTRDVVDSTGILVALSDIIQFTAPTKALTPSIDGISNDGTSIGSLEELGDESVSLKATFSLTNNTDTQRNALVFAQHFDSAGYLKKVDTIPAVVESATSDKPITLTLTERAYTVGDYLMFYVWDVTGGDFVPALSVPFRLEY